MIMTIIIAKAFPQNINCIFTLDTLSMSVLCKRPPIIYHIKSKEDYFPIILPQLEKEAQSSMFLLHFV